MQYGRERLIIEGGQKTKKKKKKKKKKSWKPPYCDIATVVFLFLRKTVKITT